MKIIRAYILLTYIIFNVYSYAQVQNNGNLEMHDDAKIGLWGDLTNNSTFTSNSSSLYIVGTNSQTINGSNLINTNNLIINKSANSLQLDNELKIAGVLTFTNGKILSDTIDMDTEFIHFLDGSSYTGASNTSYINGVVRKTGNDSFVFPVGDNNLLRTIGISAPGVVTDHYTSYYVETNPDNFHDNNSLDEALDHISGCEFWMLNRSGGISDVEITLSWSTNSGGVNNLCDINIARWNDIKWKKEGNGGTTGSGASGTVVTGNSCNTPISLANFGLFTIGSSSTNNTLPIELLSFQVETCNSKICLAWQTESEINNSHFTIERSINAKNFEAIKTVEGAGNSNSILNYSSFDYYPLNGISYYRLKQTDFDGQSTYSQIESILFDRLENNTLIAYPNPTKNFLIIEVSQKEIDGLQVFNSLNQNITSDLELTKENSSKYKLNLVNLASGIYLIKTETIFFKLYKL
jgi:hypothetical protein